MVREYLRFFVLHLCMLVLFNKCMLSYSQSRGVDLKHVEQVLTEIVSTHYRDDTEQQPTAQQHYRQQVSDNPSIYMRFIFSVPVMFRDLFE